MCFFFVVFAYRRTNIVKCIRIVVDNIYRLCKCVQYAITAALNHEKNDRHSERITKIKPFINRHSWEGINYPSEKNG